MRNPIHGITDQRDAFFRGIEHLENRLLSVPEGTTTAIRTGPDKFQRLAFPVHFLGVSGGQQCHRHGLRQAVAVHLPARYPGSLPLGSGSEGAKGI